ncbi:uncharacterized protein LOC110178927 isoform X2 [Drosophila serrata]|uniref:uncharacterized protein LOC110178927 isoform X2 n=1 Tax=Drosophila serrata TaxID=7274 RepID=UPI000A1CF459|nr:uncharacterized protein LOC110178927 isoform X2 [Drosophila serrata]
MNNSDISEESTDALNYKRNEKTSEKLKSMECFEDDYKPIVTKSSPELSFLKSKGSPESEEDNQPKSETDNDYTNFLKQMNVRYSQYRLKSGEDNDKEGQTMNYTNYNCSECSGCEGPSCSWQGACRNGQDCTSGAQMDSTPYMEQEMPDNGHYYNCGKSLSNLQSVSDETIVNGPRVSASDASESPPSSYNVCCPLRRPGQQPACYSCHHGYPCQEQFMQMNMPPPMEIDPNTGFPYFPCSAPVNYPGMGMGPMPGMQMDQRGRGGQQNEEMSSSSSSGSPAVQSSSQDGGANNQSNFNMEEFIQKYQKSVQQCYATAQQGLRQSFAQANGTPYFNQQGNQQYFANSNSGAQQMFASQSQAPQFYDPNQEAYQGLQTFNSSLDPQQFFNSPGSLGSQQFLTSPMAMPSPNIFGNNTGFISDTLHTQTVYSSDYKSFANDGNHFNHFPNGIDIGLGPDSCPSYGPAASPGLAEMGAGGQAYGMGGAGGMNMSSYPLNHMSYSSPYTFDMSSPTSGHHPGLGMANGGNLM